MQPTGSLLFACSVPPRHFPSVPVRVSAVLSLCDRAPALCAPTTSVCACAAELSRAEQRARHQLAPRDPERDSPVLSPAVCSQAERFQRRTAQREWTTRTAQSERAATRRQRMQPSLQPAAQTQAARRTQPAAQRTQSGTVRRRIAIAAATSITCDRGRAATTEKNHDHDREQEGTDRRRRTTKQQRPRMDSLPLRAAAPVAIDRATPLRVRGVTAADLDRGVGATRSENTDRTRRPQHLPRETPPHLPPPAVDTRIANGIDRAIEAEDAIGIPNASATETGTETVRGIESAIVIVIVIVMKIGTRAIAPCSPFVSTRLPQVVPTALCPPRVCSSRTSRTPSTRRR